MYSLKEYGLMIADHVRIDAYAQALRKSVRPGSVVVDIGTGPGIFAVLACQLGASRVYAIEPNDIIQVASHIAAANGCADRIKFIQDLSTHVTLPERADVIVSDLRGVLPFYHRHIPAIADARSRFLAGGGTLIPRKDTVWAAIVEGTEHYRNLVDPWDKNTLSQDLSPARSLTLNNFSKARLIQEQLLTRSQLWATLDYLAAEDPDFRGELRWTVERPGTASGIAAWFDTELADGVAFSYGKDTPESIYGSLFFPWTEPVSLSVGQIVRVDLMAKLVGDDYVWRWDTRVKSANGSGDAVVFEQSQLKGTILSLAQLHRAGSDYVPQISEIGLVDRRILELMDGGSTLEEIARTITLEFPQRFTRWQDALAVSGSLSIKYGR
jgi:protein arginine N-methyltransferase 1